jgi:hypothetical protein
VRTHDHCHLGIAIEYTELVSSLGGALEGGKLGMSKEIDRRRAYQYDASHAAKHTQFVGKGACNMFLFGVLFHPAQCLSDDGIRNVHGRRTVRSLMSVDFPAPLGPTIPTRLSRCVSKFTTSHMG